MSVSYRAIVSLEHRAAQLSTRLLTIGIALASASIWPACDRDRGSSAESPRSATGDIWFEEIGQAAKIDFQHEFAVQKKYYLPESMSGGVGLLDFDGDGFLDVYLVQGGELDPDKKNPYRNRMYRNRGDGSFEDVTESTGTGDRGYGMGCACGDYDGDGDVDLYVTNVGPNVLFRNNGNGTFSNVTDAAGVAEPGWGASAVFADYNGDGRLDLFVTNYIGWSPEQERLCVSLQNHRDYCGPTTYGAPTTDTLYRNEGNGAFVDVTRRVGIDTVRGNGLGVVAGDFNGDGWTDFYVANDQNPNALWVNAGNGRFVEDALLAGCALNQSGSAEAGMGVIAIDADYDGDLDLFMTHLQNESHTFYRNSSGVFADVTAIIGLGAPSLPFTGFGVGFADFDHDSRLDLLVVNGRVRVAEPTLDVRKPYAEPNQLFRGLANGKYDELQPAGGTSPALVETSRGAAFGDLDNDGDIDVVVVNYGARVHVLNNVAGVAGRWIMFRVLNSRGGYAIGASVRIQAGDKTQWRQVQRAYSYCSSNDPRVHFGLGKAERVEEVLVRWPDGQTQTFGRFKSDAIHELRRGS